MVKLWIAYFFLLVSLELYAGEWCFNIKNMSCPSCASTLKNAALSVEGVKNAQVNFSKKSLKIETATTGDTENNIKASLQSKLSDKGYPAEIVNCE